MMEKWQQLAPREKRWVLGGGITLLVMFLYLVIWEPVATERQRLITKVPQQQKLLAWMEQSSQTVATLRKQTGKGTVALNGSLLGVIDKQAKAAGLASSVKRMDPQGDKVVRVTLEQADFDKVIRWLGDLEGRFGIMAKAITIERSDSPGKASVRATLEI